MRHRRYSDPPPPCCGCGCQLCGTGSPPSSPLWRSRALRPVCTFSCPVEPGCAFQSRSLDKYERHLLRDHKELLADSRSLLDVDDEHETAGGASVLIPQVSIKEEPFEANVADAVAGKSKTGRRGRKRKYKSEDVDYEEEEEADLVYDDDEDEDYNVAEDFYLSKWKRDWKQEYGEEEYDAYGYLDETYDDGTEDLSRCGYAGCDFATDQPGGLSAHEGVTHLRWVKKAFEANAALMAARVEATAGGKWGCLLCSRQEQAKVAATLHVSREHSEGLEDVTCRDCDFACKHPKTMRDHFKTTHLARDESRRRPGNTSLSEPQVCVQCGFEARSRRQLRQHEVEEHGEASSSSYTSRQCDLCDYIALNRRQLRRHRAEEHPEAEPAEAPILCHLCGFSTETRMKLQRHVAAKHGNYQCDQCDFRTPLHRKLVQHVKNIHREICPVCALPINDGESLREGNHACPAVLGPGKPDPDALFRVIHIKNTSREIGCLRDNGGYVCLDCGAVYRVMLVMRRHVVMMHGSHLCTECDFVGESRPILDRHMSERHPTVCRKCGVEDGEAPHECAMMPNVSADPTGMNPAKTKRNRLRLTTCDIPGCSVVFADRKALRLHRKEAHGREAQVPCEVCGKYFANNTKLKLHVKTQHEGIKDMACPFCAYATGDSGNFIKHVRKSHPERDCSCPYPPCAFRAASMSALSRHVVAEHRMAQPAPDQQVDQKPPLPVELSMDSPMPLVAPSRLMM